ARQHAHLEVDRAGGDDDGERIAEPVDRLVVVAALRERLCTREDRLGPGTLVARDAAREERGVYSEPRGEPLDGFTSRLRLAALDLGDVFLREAIAGELALRQPGRDAELAEPVAQPRAARNRGSRACRPALHHAKHAVLAEEVSIPHLQLTLQNRMVVRFSG